MNLLSGKFSVLLFLPDYVASCAGFSSDEESRLEWIIGTPLEGGRLSKHSHLADGSAANDVTLEFGPR